MSASALTINPPRAPHWTPTAGERGHDLVGLLALQPDALAWLSVDHYIVDFDRAGVPGAVRRGRGPCLRKSSEM